MRHDNNAAFIFMVCYSLPVTKNTITCEGPKTKCERNGKPTHTNVTRAAMGKTTGKETKSTSFKRIKECVIFSAM